jgi:hypothetical protein
MRRSIRLVTTLSPALAVAALALAASYEAPRTFRAADLLAPAQVKGPHHAVAAEVKGEGYLLRYDLTTDFGPLEAEGTSMLLTRLREVDALAELDKVSKSEVFAKAAGQSVLNVGKGAAAAVKDPAGTAKGVGGAAKRFGTNLGRKAKRTTDSAVESTKKEPTDEGSQKSTGEKSAEAASGIAKSTLGVNSSARKWAQKVGVDPYTSNPILKKALTDLGKIDAAGGLAAKIAVPIPPVVSSTATVGNLVWSQDPEALLKANEKKLADLGVSGDVIKKLYVSKGFTLSLMTRLVVGLSAVKVPGCADYVATAAEADTGAEALFFAESAEMLARFHQATPVAALLPDSRALVAKTRAGQAVLLLPLDWMSWTSAYDKALTEITRRASAELGAKAVELRTTGALSPLAKEQTTARGVKVVEKLPRT